MGRSRLVLPAAVVVAALASFALARSAGTERAPATDDRAALASMSRLCEGEASERMRASCYSRKLVAVIADSRDPAHELSRIDVYARGAGGFLGASCHILMHAVGRAYALQARVTLAQLQSVLPTSNDPSCSAGFSHGLIMGLGPQIMRAGPQGALAECERAATRYERYSCVHGLGHAYMRTFDDHLAYALPMCRRLGEQAPDCAQGAFHDYWLSLSGSDGTYGGAKPIVSPRKLCAGQQPQFVAPCWYRAYIELPSPTPLGTGHALLELCRGLAGLQRSGCITAGSVVTSADPYEQARQCATLTAADALACVHGVRAQALARRSPRAQDRLAESCSRFVAGARGGCYRWLGKALAVVTNGRFACGALADAADCRAGARDLNSALATFS